MVRASMTTNAGVTKQSPPTSPPHHPPPAYPRKIPSWVAVAPGSMFATASPTTKRSFDTHRRRSCSSACMMPMIAGPPYEVAPSLKSEPAISLKSVEPAIRLAVIMCASRAREPSPIPGSLLRRCPRDLQVRELGHRVGLGPQPDPSPGEGLVVVVEEQRVVQVGLDLRPLGDDADLVPLPELRFGDSRRRDGAPPPVDDRVQPEVVLERVGANQEVVLTVGGSQDDAPAGIFFPRDR